MGASFTPAVSHLFLDENEAPAEDFNQKPLSLQPKCPAVISQEIQRRLFSESKCPAKILNSAKNLHL